MKNSDMPAMPQTVRELIPTKRQSNFGGAVDDVKMGDVSYKGLTKLEAMSAMAMQGILANNKYEPPRRDKLEGIGMESVNAAKFLLAALEKENAD